MVRSNEPYEHQVQYVITGLARENSYKNPHEIVDKTVQKHCIPSLVIESNCKCGSVKLKHFTNIQHKLLISYKLTKQLFRTTKYTSFLSTNKDFAIRWEHIHNQ